MIEINAWAFFWGMILAPVGLLTILYFMVWPLFDALMWGVGYSIHRCRSTGWARIKAKPFRAVLLILILWPWQGIKLWLLGPSTKSETNGHVWKPWFNYMTPKMEGGDE